MREQVFWSIGIRLYPPRLVLQLLVASTRGLIVRATIVDMDVPPHRGADEVTHHRRTFIIGGELATFDFQWFIVRSIHGPAGTRHGAMACLVFLLWMALEESLARAEIVGL